MSVRLLFAGTTFVVGGAERVLSHLVLGLRRPPFEVELLALREPGAIGEELRAAGVPVHGPFTGASRFDPWVIVRLHRFLKAGRYDAIYFLDHAHAVFYTTLASAGTSVRARVMPVHTTGQWNGQPSLKRPIRLIRKKLHRIIAIAETQRRYLIEEEHVDPAQLVVIPNGIPVEAPEESERARRRAEVRRELGVSDATPVVGITAVLRPEKNHELLLAAFADLRRTVPDAELWIVGDGPRRAALEEEARRFGLGKAARFLGHRTDARRLMAGFDVATLTSHPRVETLPLSLLEAMDAGLPVVATDVGAIREMIEDGISGRVVPQNDATALSVALTGLLLDPAARALAGARGAAIVRERFSVERMCLGTERLLLELLDGGRGTSTQR